MGIIDEMDNAVGYRKPQTQEAAKEFRPSSYNPLDAYPENLMQDLRGSGEEIRRGAEQLGKGELLSGAFNVGMGALRGFYSPLEAGVQNITQPLSDTTGIPEWLLTSAAMIPVGYGGYKGIAGGARRLMGLGGEAAPVAEAAPAVEAVEPRIGATNRAEWERSYAERKKAYQEGVGSKRTAQMSEAAERTPPVSPAERFFPQEGPKLLPQFGKGEPIYRMPDESVPPRTSMRESYAEGYRPGGQAEQMMFGPERMLPPPAIRLPDQRPKWQQPTAEMGILMPGIGRRPEEIAAGMGQRRMLPEQQLPDYSTKSFVERAVGLSGEMKAAREEAKANVIPDARPTKRIARKPTAEQSPPSLSKEQKLKTLEAEGMRSLYDAVRTLETSGMDSTEAEQHILNNIKAGYMTAVKPNGSPLTASEAKKLRSLKGLGGVTWIRG